MTNARLAQTLRPIAALIFVGGWIFAGVAFAIIGTETCATTQIPLVGPVETCTDTTSSSVIIVATIGFAATVGSLVLWALSYLADAIEPGTRRGG